jgi:hypothetical protein
VIEWQLNQRVEIIINEIPDLGPSMFIDAPRPAVPAIDEEQQSGSVTNSMSAGLSRTDLFTHCLRQLMWVFVGI